MIWLNENCKYAWAAGIIDGEGSLVLFTNEKKKDKVFLAISVYMTDYDIICRLKEVFPNSNITGPYKRNNPNHKDQYLWKISNQAGMMDCIKRILPYLGERRTKQAHMVLEFCELRLANKFNKKCRVDYDTVKKKYE